MTEDEATEPYILPFEDIFLRRRDEIIRLVALSTNAMRSMEGTSRLGEALKYDEERLDHIRTIEEQTLNEVGSGFPLLYGAATVLLWGALETSIRDFVVRWIECRPEVRNAPEVSKIKITFGDFDKLDEEGRIRYLVGLLERNTGAALKPGAGRFDAILEIVGISANCTSQNRRSLANLAAIRNVIVHRAGIADDRFVSLCPKLGCAVGDTVFVTGADFDDYISASSEYVISIIESARKVADAA